MTRKSWPALTAAILAVAACGGLQAADDAPAEDRVAIDFVTGLNDPVVGYINERIRIGWQDNEVSASPLADDEEWLRRVTLDLSGRIPTLGEVADFVADDSPTKRADKIDALLDSEAFVDHWATQWTNLLIGRNAPQRTNRDGLLKFLRDSIALGRPWDEIVVDLITAEGNFRENGAVNFLLAKLDGNPRDDDYHVEATASTTRLFLGMQVQCTQCHNHPFNDWKQDQFWEFNSFLRQIRRNDVRDAMGNDDYSELVARDYTDPVFFEKRSGLMQVAYPNYFGTQVDPKSEDRRGEFAKLVAGGADGENLLAKAFVNRSWSQLYGYAFTRPVDDMGPHNPPSHPELLDRLTAEFVASDYDVRQLFRWMANAEAYNLTSRFNRDGSNSYDDPAAGEVPLFSHAYVKSLSAEQLYDSMVVATGAGQDARGDRAKQTRDRWLRDFLRIFGGNEEDEPTLFAGSIPQALLMMNGELIQRALDGESESVFTKVLASGDLRTDKDRVEALYRAALGRKPTRSESSGLTSALGRARGDEKLWLYQDLYWALLNSNEFIFNH